SVATFKYRHMAQRTYFLPLRRRQRSSHRGKSDLDVVSREGQAQFKRISPDTPNSVGAHQNAPGLTAMFRLASCREIIRAACFFVGRFGDHDANDPVEEFS